MVEDCFRIVIAGVRCLEAILAPKCIGEGDRSEEGGNYKIDGGFHTITVTC